MYCIVYQIHSHVLFTTFYLFLLYSVYSFVQGKTMMVCHEKPGKMPNDHVINPQVERTDNITTEFQ